MKQYEKNGVIKYKSDIVLKKIKTVVRNGIEKEVVMNVYNPTEDMILADGWVEYIVPPVEPNRRKSPIQVMQEIVFEEYNSRTDITNEEALDRMIIIYDWEHYIGKPLKVGQCVVEGDNVYRVRQDINEVLEIYPPSVVSALYEVIEMVHTGDINDPIPYVAPMTLENGKYYIEENILYKCIRNSEIAVSHNLKDLINLYVEQV